MFKTEFVPCCLWWVPGHCCFKAADCILKLPHFAVFPHLPILGWCTQTFSRRLSTTDSPVCGDSVVMLVCCVPSCLFQLVSCIFFTLFISFHSFGVSLFILLVACLFWFVFYVARSQVHDRWLHTAKHVEVWSSFCGERSNEGSKRAQ